jgi:disintegrin and metalloproteinase domain-containing protein 10
MAVFLSVCDKEYWWAVLLMGVGLVVLMALFIKICAVHTPSSNPKQPPARKLTLPRRQAHRSQVLFHQFHDG